MKQSAEPGRDAAHAAGTTPLVSILTPTFNGGRFIRDAIESVLAQTHENVEHVVVDDGSTDDTRAIVEELAARDERVRVLAFDERAGPTRRRNDALAAAAGTYVAWLDHDDMFLPRKLELQVARLERGPDLGFAYSQYERFDDATGTVLERSEIREHAPLLEQLFVEGCFIASSTVTFRRSALELRGLRLRESHFSFGDDHFLWLALSLDWKGALVDEVLTRIRVHAGNESSRLARENTALWSVGLLREFVRAYPDAAAKLGPARRRGLANHYVRAALYELAALRRARGLRLLARAAALAPRDTTRFAVEKIVPAVRLRRRGRYETGA